MLPAVIFAHAWLYGEAPSAGSEAGQGGGTAKAAASLVERIGGTVCGIACLIELDFLHGRDKLEGHDLFTLIQY